MKRTFFKDYTKWMAMFLHGIGHDSSGAEKLAEDLYNAFEVEDQHLADDCFWFPIKDYFEKTVIPHKIEVFKAGMEVCKALGLNEWEQKRMVERLIVHDFSKFSCDEHIAYSSYNFKDKSKNSESAKMQFEAAWNHHKHCNDHHPEHWLAVNRDGTTQPLIMDRWCQMEMIADWIGAGRTYGSTLEAWLPSNIHTFVFHEVTARTLSVMLNQLVFTDDTNKVFKFDGNKVVLKEFQAQ